MLLAAANAGEIALLLLGDGAADPQLEQLRVAANGVERSAKLVRHRREKLALRAVRHLGFRNSASVGDRALLGGAAFREIARHLREADQLSRRIPNGGDDDIGPELRAVLPIAPTFVFEASPGRGLAQLPRRLAIRDVFGGVEGREVPPDDLVVLVSLDGFRALVPRRDDAAWIQHEDRVVLHALHEQAKALFALAKRFLGEPAFGEIASNFRESHVHSGVIAKGGDDDVRPEARSVLADAPSLFLETAFLDRDLELPGGLVARDLLVRIENREMPPDDLVRLVAFHSLRAFVPAQNVTRGVEREDGVVAHPVDEQTVEVDVCTERAGRPVAQGVRGWRLDRRGACG